MAETLTPNEKRSRTQRANLDRKFPDRADEAEHFRQLAAKSNGARLTLSATDAEALDRAYATLERLASKIRAARPGRRRQRRGDRVARNRAQVRRRLNATSPDRGAAGLVGRRR
jgi:hypothetical protein